MKLGHRCLATTLVLVVGLTTLAALGDGAFAATRTISVAPSTGLSEGDRVTATIFGFTPGATAALVECRAGATQQSDCDLGNLQLVAPDQNGAAIVQIVVHRRVTTQNGAVDCSPANACAIGAAEVSDIPNTAVSQGITFGPLPPPVRGSVAVMTPSTVEGQGLEVLGSGWTVGATINVAECPGGTSVSGPQCVNITTQVADVDGAFVLTLPSSAALPGLDCSASFGTCEVFAADAHDEAATYASAPIQVYPSKLGTFEVTPNTNVSSGDTVTVTGSGWSPDRDLAIFLCFSDCNTYRTYRTVATTDATGSFTATTTVDNWHYEGRVAGSAEFCGPPDTGCLLQVLDESSEFQATLPLTFNPSGPATQGSVSGDPNPVAGDKGIESVSGWAANVPVAIGQCPVGSFDPFVCVWQFTTSDAHGTATVSRVVNEGIGGTDCTVAGHCEYVAWDGRDPAGTRTTAPFTATLPDPGTIVVTPSTGLHDGETVTVSGVGWRPNSPSVVAECSAEASCNSTGTPLMVFTDGTGSFSTEFTVNESASDGNGWLADCTASASACAVTMQQYAGDRVLTATAPLAFANPTAVTITSHYTATELANIHAAATQLALTDDQYQRVSVWATLWLLGITHTSTVPPGTDTGNGSITTTYPNFEGNYITAFAAAHNTTPADLQKGSALLIAYILGLPG